MQRLAVVLVLACLALGAQAMLPGLTPHNYQSGDNVELKVNKLDSVKTQLAYEYYKLPFCQPKKIVNTEENLGEALLGDVIQNSPYEIKMMHPESCKILCGRKYSLSEQKQFASMIKDEYRINWLLDGLPVATKAFVSTGNTDLTPIYEKGFPLGFVPDAKTSSEHAVINQPYLNNHASITILYHQEPESYSGYRIVGFEVVAYSIDHHVEGTWDADDMSKNKLTSGCSNRKPLAVVAPNADDINIVWTYDVNFEPSSTSWSSRMDMYFRFYQNSPQIHWFSIINSFIIVVALAGIIAIILLRTLSHDITRYNEETEESQNEETGWKLVHADVFRHPKHPALFSVLIGTGAQLLAMAVPLMVLALLGFLSPEYRGSLLNAVLLLFCFMGAFAGYYSTQSFKMFQLANWKRNTLYTAIFYPGINFGVFFTLNLLLWYERSSSAIPFADLVILLVLWLGISLPLVYFGSYVAFRKEPPQFPTKINMIPREIPPQAWYAQPAFIMMAGGVVPFGACFMEIFYIMTSVWLHEVYYMFGFLFVVFIILCITCAEVSIVAVYFQLVGEDYRWWWRSYFTSGTAGLYLFLYSIFYFFAKLNITKFVSIVIYFGYMFLISFGFCALTGVIGYFASFYFVTKIYSVIKTD